jgi:diguanylate cyclase (GGDEF)-like protein
MRALSALDQLAGSIATVLGVPWIVVTHYVGAELVVAVAHGFPTEHRAGVAAAIPTPLCHEIALEGRAIVVQDARRCIPRVTAEELGISIGGYAGVPLVAVDGSSIGSLAAITQERRTWQERDLHVLHGFARAAAAVLEAMVLRLRCRDLELHAAELEVHASRISLHARDAAVEQRRTTRALEVTALHDELTGLLNRRGCFAAGTDQIVRARVRGDGGLVVFADIDGLKGVNDRAGHAAGDELLRDAAGVLRACFTEDDTIARLGGDEFVVVARDVAPDDIPVIAARLAAELVRVNARRDPQIPLRWSVGMVAVDPGADIDFDRLVRAADRKMYLQKRVGYAPAREDDPVLEEHLNVVP